MNTQVTMYVKEINGSENGAFLHLVCSLHWGETGLVHRIGLDDWWEHPVCQYGIMGWPNGVVRTLAADWIG
jgi:hypothetical protein